MEAEKNGDKDRKALYKLMDNAAYEQKIENLRNRIDVRLVSNEKDYLKWTSKPSYMSHKIYDNDLFAIRKHLFTLTLKIPAYIGMCILELNKLLMCEYYYDYTIKNKCHNNSRLLLTDTDNLISEIKTEDGYKD